MLEVPARPAVTPGRFATLALGAVALFSFTLVPPAHGCSMCRCGDPTFNALGTDVYAEGNFRIAIDGERFEKEQAISEEHDHEEEAVTAHEEESGREAQVERRVTATMSYAFDRVNLVARIPWSDRTLRTIGESGSETSNGLADPELYALVRLWSSPFVGDLGRRAWISAVGGVKTPWGENDLKANGERLEEHLQSGTGSTDWFGGFSGVYLLNSQSSLFGSLQYRKMGTNDFDYRYGDVRLLNLGYERKLGKRVDASLETNYRDADQDSIEADGELDPNTGGAVLYLSPRLSADFGRGLVGRLSFQIPVADHLDGDQTEKAVANFGLTFLVR
ncbi:MAG TPA: hypothetical protein VGS22_21365 [Thermoanaerobaculia bacterium]|jgi:hypothetical protein|nr:hypothetical protein [Thermoanaerobaculia bacterium]